MAQFVAKGHQPTPKTIPNPSGGARRRVHSVKYNLGMVFFLGIKCDQIYKVKSDSKSWTDVGIHPVVLKNRTKRST